MVSTTLKALVASFSLLFTEGFQIPAQSTYSRGLTQCQAFSTVDRRSFIAFGSSIAGLTISLPANADVADGNALPDGAAQFKRLVRLKTDLAVSAKTYDFLKSTIIQEPTNMTTFILKMIQGRDD